MRKNKTLFISVVFALVMYAVSASGQHETVISLLKSDKRLAEDYYKKQDYRNALTLYENLYRRKSKDSDTRVKIARCYYFLKEYDQAVNYYSKVSKSPTHFSNRDLYYYSEAYASTGDVSKAAEILRYIVSRSPNDTIAANKLWRFSNIQYLYEDSLHYVVRPMTQLNTPFSDIFVGEADGRLYFLSDKPEVRLIEKIDASGSNFYNIYTSKKLSDTLSSREMRFKRPAILSGELNIRAHAGPVAFFDGGQKVVHATISAKPGRNGKHSLQLKFLEKENNSWRVMEEFPFNSTDYSVTDPSISGDGKVLYFSSDMPGGKGGKDIYRSMKVEGKWTTPQNMTMVNSPFDEISPFNHLGKTLYFSSNGHPGMGGFDIFKIEYRGDYWSEVMNVGYPINSFADDFGMVVDSPGTNGYLTSNRKKGGLDDDMYNVEINIQAYPITIAGLVRIKEHAWSDSSDVVPYPNAKFQLLDNVRNTVMYEAMTDATGAVNIAIPYFSKYKIRITGQDRVTHIASFDIPKNQKVDDRYEIVLVRDMYESTEPADPQNR